MKLQISDFRTSSIANLKHFYYPGNELQKTDYYKSYLLEHELSNEFVHNWIFKVNKSDVFKELGWKESLTDHSHLDGNALFPEFADLDQVKLFLTITILLHNEKT